MSDFSAYFQIDVNTSLDGTTLVGSVPWGPNPPTQYRAATVQSLGRIPIDVFTRSAQEPGGKSPPASIAREGALIVARWLPESQTTTMAEIGIWPQSGTYETQVQRLTSDLAVRVWGFPGDELWLRDNNPAGSRGRLDLFIRGLNFRDLDTLLELPRPGGDATAARIVFQAAQNILPTEAFRTIYVLAPPQAGFNYNLPDPSAVVGKDLVFVNPTALNTGLVSTTNLQNQPNTLVSYLGARRTAHLTSYGSHYTELGTLGDEPMVLTQPTDFGPWRGIRQVRCAQEGPHTLPSAGDVAPGSMLIITNQIAPVAVINAQAGQTINGLPNVNLGTNQSRIYTPISINQWASV